MLLLLAVFLITAAVDATRCTESIRTIGYAATVVRPAQLLANQCQKRLASAVAAVSGVTAVAMPMAVSASSAPLVKASALLEDKAYEKPLFNVPPGRIAYPKYLLGRWRTELKFAGAEFTKQISTEKLAQDPNVPGFRKYSVAFVPDFGSDCTAVLRFTEEGNKAVFEDRAANIQALMEAFMSKDSAVVDTIEYDGGNRCSLVYHDSKGEGKIEMFTNSRNSRDFSDGGFESIEQLRQFNARKTRAGGSYQTLGDYAIRWRFAAPLSAESSALDAQLQVFSYLQPQDALYFERPSKPVAVFAYDARFVKTE